MRFFVPTFAILFIFGCGGQHPKPTQFDADPAPFIKRVNERNDAIASLTAELTVELWRGAERLRFTQMVAVDHQKRLRIDALSPMGSPISTLVSDGGRLMLYAVSQKRFFIGESSPENLGRLLPVPLDPSELSMLIRGAIPMIEARSKRLEWNAKDGHYSLILEGEKGREIIGFDPKSYDVIRIERWIEDALRYAVRFADYEGAPNLRVPQRIRLEVPDGKIEVDMTVKNHQVNPDLPLEAFQLKPPRGVVVQSF